ncbi:FK506-binding protein 2B [Coemansia thaxteri]|nr:FK506-binding protein 2B [Coemansia thaxteri]KAJ2469190.1 FK506-binding protein 2B [Coemansia sp. RSA 2322]
MSEIAPKWTAEELSGDGVSKKDIISYLHENANNNFLLANKLNGKLASVANTAKKPALVAAYKNLFETKQFRSSDEVSASDVKQQKTPIEVAAQEPEPSQAVKEPKYVKLVTKKGTGDRCPTKGDRVSVFYSGWLEDGKLFDTNTAKKGNKPPSPLVFKVGTKRVIQGWDEALLTMVKGEKASLTVHPDWAYGKRGNEAAGIPPNATLVFEVELVSID